MSSSNKPNILVVEDNKFDRLIIRTALESHCLITEAGTLREADTLLKTQSFGLVILDGSLPDGDGFAFCKKMREQELNYIPVIFLTGRASIDEKVAGFAVGADDYIVKPLEPQEFIARVQSKLRHKDALSKIPIQN